MATLPARAAEVATDLIISEYVEGSSSNKAIEFFNGTDRPIDLSSCTVEVYFNGTSSADTKVTLTGSLAPGETGDLTYADTVLAAGFDGNDFTPGGASRIPDGADTDTPTDWLRNDFDLAGIEGVTGTPVLGEALNTPGTTNSAVGPIDQGGVCGDPVTAIGAVQGAGAMTPLAGEAVSVEGAVVGDFLIRGFDGYYVQDEGDGDWATQMASSFMPSEPRVVYVASGEDAPVVLTRARALPPKTVQALTELDVRKVVMVGGKRTIPDSVLTAIGEASGAPVTHVAGANRYDLAAKISDGWTAGEVDTVYLASGTTFADALAVGHLAGIESSPVLLTAEGSLSSETAAALDRLDPARIVILGGPDRISDTVFAQASAYADTSRLFGVDRYDTAAKIVLQIPGSDEVLLASGQVFPDALAGGVYAGVNAPLLLTKADSLNDFAASALQGREPSVVTLIGGEMMLFDQVRLDVIALFDN